jgi:hypothetical protein
MLDAKDFVLAAERDAILIAATRQALHAMEVTNGCSIRMDGVRGILDYDRHIEKLKLALQILGMGAMDFSAPPSRGRN